MRAVIVLALITCGATCVAAQEATPLMQRPVARDVVTEESLRQQMEGARTMQEMLDAAGPTVQRVRPGDRQPKPRNNLFERSILLADGEFFTCIPLGSVLHLPSALRGRVVAKPVGQFQLWPAFLKRNASWLATQEVPLAMALGDDQIAQEILGRLTGEKRAIVAVHRDGPITILEAAPEAANRN